MKVKHTSVYRPGSGNYDPLTICLYTDADGDGRTARLPGHLTPGQATSQINRLNALAEQKR